MNGRDPGPDPGAYKKQFCFALILGTPFVRFMGHGSTSSILKRRETQVS